MNVNGKWYTETELQAYVKELESRISELEDKHFSECGQIAAYSDENAKMKELLRKAVEDFTKVLCNNDAYNPNSCGICANQNNCNYSDSFKWRYTDEALALIGEDGEENG